MPQAYALCNRSRVYRARTTQELPYRLRTRRAPTARDRSNGPCLGPVSDWETQAEPSSFFGLLLKTASL